MKACHILVSCILSLSAFSACDQFEPEQPSNKNITVLLPWMDGESNYSYQPVTLNSLTNLERVRGPHARFHYQPSVTDESIRGIQPHARFVKTDKGHYLPLDYLSTQMFTIYAHLEKLAEMDEALGIDLSQRPPRQVGVTLPIDGDQSSKLASLRNNAYYFGSINTLLIVPYRLPDLPIGINGGVIGHEHFHSHFYYLFSKDIQQARPDFQGLDLHEDDRIALIPDFKWPIEANRVRLSEEEQADRDAQIDQLYLELIFSGLNEGLADYWAWLYSQQSNFVGASLSFQEKARDLDIDPRSIPTRIGIRNTIRSLSIGQPVLMTEEMLRTIKDHAYILGADVARVLRKLSIPKNGRMRDSDRLELATRVLTALSSFKDELLLANDMTERGPSDFLIHFLKSSGEPRSTECKLLTELIDYDEALTARLYCKMEILPEGVMLD